MSDIEYIFHPETIAEHIWFRLRQVRSELSKLGLGRLSQASEKPDREQVVDEVAVFSTEVELPGRRASEHLRAIKLRLDELLPVAASRLTISVRRLAEITASGRRYQIIAIDDDHVAVGSEVLVLPGGDRVGITSKAGILRMQIGLRRSGIAMLAGFLISAVLSSTITAHYEQQLLVNLGEQRQVSLALTRARRASELADVILSETGGALRVSETLVVSSWLVENLPNGVTLRSMRADDGGVLVETAGDMPDGAEVFENPPEGFALEYDSAVRALRLRPNRLERAHE